MMLHQITYQGKDFLFNKRVILSQKVWGERLSDLEKELETIDKKYSRIFELQALYDVLPESIISKIAQLQLEECYETVTDMDLFIRIRRISESFCSLEMELI